MQPDKMISFLFCTYWFIF